jgi:5-methylcytosine-specific restriction endonuclease McrA
METLTEEQTRYKAYKQAYKRYRDNERFDGLKKVVLERDNYTCQSCGMTNEEHISLFDRELTVHHLDGKGRYSKEKNNHIDNLQTLCLRCHGRFDHRINETGKVWRKKVWKPKKILTTEVKATSQKGHRVATS